MDSNLGLLLLLMENSRTLIVYIGDVLSSVHRGSFEQIRNIQYWLVCFWCERFKIDNLVYVDVNVVKVQKKSRFCWESP